MLKSENFSADGPYLGLHVDSMTVSFRYLNNFCSRLVLIRVSVNHPVVIKGYDSTHNCGTRTAL